MKPIARCHHAPGPERAREPDPSAQIEQALVAAEDARSEAFAAVRERDALAAALGEARAELRDRDAEIAALRKELARAKEDRDFERASGSATTEELKIAMEELQASAASLEIANDDLFRLNSELERRIAERTAALAESETRLRATTDAVPHLVWTADAGGMWTWANRRWTEYTGQSSPDSTGLGWLERVHSDDRERTMASWARAEASGEFLVEHRLRAADGSYRWFATRALPERRGSEHEEGPPAGGGRAPAWYGTSTDVEDARRAEEALRESEARFRGFAETSEDVLWIADGEGRKLEYLSPAFERVWGEPRSAVASDLSRWADLLHPEDRSAVLDLLPRVLRGERVQVEYRIRRSSDGAVRWIHDTGFPIRDASGRVERVAGLAQDVTEQRENELRQKLLLNELNHRVKNALAGAQALAAQTARGGASGNPGTFLRAFEERLRALARAHDLLTREGWRGASLSDVVRATLAPHDSGPGRVAASGPEVRLAPGAAVALHMAFHELATNAVKHGSLSVPGGRVEVAWTKQPAGGGDGGAPAELAIRWRERGGPPVPGPPAVQGFGSRLLDRGLPQQLGGEAKFDFAPAGLEFNFRLPLSARVQAS